MSFWKRVHAFCCKIDLLTVIFSLILGTLIWFYVNDRRTAVREVRARVEITVPDEWQMVDNTLPRYRTVTLRGPQAAMQNLRQDDIRFVDKITISEESNARGTSAKEIDISLKPESLRGVPDTVQVVDIADPKLTINLVRPVRKYIPVEVQLEGTVPEGCVLTNYRHSPQYIPVEAPEDEFTPGLVAKTRPVPLSGRTSSFVVYADLEPLTLRNRVIGRKEAIFTEFTIEPRKAQKKIENVPVGLLLATPMEKLSGHKIIPNQVTVRVEGSDSALSALDARGLTVYIDSRDLGTSAQTECVLKCRALEPEGVKILEIIPAEVKWQTPETPGLR